MQSINNKLIAAVLATILVAGSGCVKDRAGFNDDHDKPYQVAPSLLLTNAQKELADQVTTPDVNLNVFRFFQHYWTMTTYFTDAQFDFAGTRRVPDNHWTALYARVIGNLQSAREAVQAEAKPAATSQEDWDKQQANKMAILDMLQVYAFQILVDSFGDVPYSEAADAGVVLPKYDDDAAIYPQLIERLKADLGQLDPSAPSFGAQEEYMLGGDVDKWKLFGNSLLLKIGINLSDVDAGLAKSAVEAAVTGGVITQNTQNVSFKYTALSPNFNPVHANVIASGRNDYIIEKTIVDMMNGLADPRRAVYFTRVGGAYVGAVLGDDEQAYEDFSHVGDRFVAPDDPGYLFDAAEVNFYLAEAAARGFSVGGSAVNYYNAAIRASFGQLGLSDADATLYLAKPAVAYATAQGDWKAKIGRQAYIAMFNRGFESWNFYRRLDYPVMTAPLAVPAADGKVPVRLTYPINEQTVNGANWRAASEAIGGDKLTTRVFWDKN
ncbi:SusD/RagB family nutrient-binding outer membrane lipoprotein [Niabella aurantiaca]|uniref:SusD/RagB family nutrient-binding outer membrane lipoprotein n=1 Tax=Niabella aurantiaca TaxID=379900 RepID=UPI000370220B|nr:SusD/RagB family nutrient-binding outer membrane lipoprotein [Niabella aurantiaca]